MKSKKNDDPSKQICKSLKSVGKRKNRMHVMCRLRCTPVIVFFLVHLHVAAFCSYPWGTKSVKLTMLGKFLRIVIALRTRSFLVNDRDEQPAKEAYYLSFYFRDLYVGKLCHHNMVLIWLYSNVELYDKLLDPPCLHKWYQLFPFTSNTTGQQDNGLGHALNCQKCDKFSFKIKFRTLEVNINS